MSRAGLRGGIEDERGTCFFDLVRCLNYLQERHAYPPVYILGNTFTGNMSDAKIRHAERQIQEFVGAPSVVDAVNTGSWAHRVRSLWTNFLPAAFLEGCAESAPQPPSLEMVLDPFHMPTLVYQDNQPPFMQLNKRGETRRVLPILVSYARSYALYSVRLSCHTLCRDLRV